MLRVIVALSLFFLSLQACEGGFNSCIAKVKDSNSIQDKVISLPITKNTRLVFSTTRPKGKILKHDPFLALYIVKGTKGFEYPFKINMREPSGIAAVDKHSAMEGIISKRQIGLNQFASFRYKIKAPAILTNSCCSLEGIVTPRGI
ncbi:MAG: Pdz/Dhr/GlgF, partial [Sulfurimonas sp.]|nr:Pdz/Dhr/GlgF [Sulfurimonas sp.]